MAQLVSVLRRDPEQLSAVAHTELQLRLKTPDRLLHVTHVFRSVVRNPFFDWSNDLTRTPRFTKRSSTKRMSKE
jgi:hypothetical protein